MLTERKPRIAVVLGDPHGIGPELVVKLIANTDISKMAEIAIVADNHVYQSGEKISGVSVKCHRTENITTKTLDTHHLVLLSTPQFKADDFNLGQVSKEAGKYQLECLTAALDLCRKGITDCLCFAPLNKEAMHMAGLKHEDEQGFFRDHLRHQGKLGILNKLGNLWTSRATSHVAHRQVSDLITTDSVFDAIKLLDTALRASGKSTPRIAVAGLNPHAGDGGMFGDEEIEIIAPAVKLAQGQGIIAEGPFPPDTIFLMGREGTYDAIVTMYHDQGQIAMKLMGFDHGVTMHAGLPFPVTTSGHGSAFDIAGKGIAKVTSLKEAFSLACSMA